MRLNGALRTARPAVILAAVALAGCGGSAKGRVITVPAYGDHPATTVAQPAARPGDPVCARDARTLADDAALFLDHYGAAAAYPADLYYVNLREDYADFAARACPQAALDRALDGRLTGAQRRTLVRNLPRGLAKAFR